MKKILIFLLILSTLCFILISCKPETDTDSAKNDSTLNSDTSKDNNNDTSKDNDNDTSNITDTLSDLLSDTLKTDTVTTDNDSLIPDSEVNTDTVTTDNGPLIPDSEVNTDTVTDENNLSTDSEPSIPDAPSKPVLPSAPNIKFTDWDGNDVTLESLRGKPVVLNFFATWCPPCKAELPDFEEAYLTYGGEVTFVLIDLFAWGTDTESETKEFYESSGYTFPIYFDTYNEGYMEYDLNSIPKTFFIDENGYLVGSVPQMITKSQLFSYIELMLNQ